MLKIIAVAACISLMLAFVMLAFENIPLEFVCGLY